MRMINGVGQHLATPSSLEGRTIRSRDKHKVGAISTVIIDEATGRIEYLLVGAGGVLRLGEKYLPIPWEHVNFDPESGDYIGDFQRDRVKTAPAYDKDQLSSTAYGWGEQVRRHFGAGAYVS